MEPNNQTEPDPLTDETRAKLKELSGAMLRLHKTLLDGTKAEYEEQYGKILSVNQYFQLVIDDSHFAWLRKISSLVALIDEAVSLRRPSTETEALALLKEAETLLNFDDEDEAFNDKFQNALQKDPNAVINHNEALKILD
ncbi:MAG: hypothetical protein R2747_02385 [Pyrinomonadaceae bacterium]